MDFILDFIQALGIRRGKSDVLGAIAFTFIPFGGLIDLISFLFLGLSSIGVRNDGSGRTCGSEKRDGDRSATQH